ncbi:TPA: trypsin-like peptidase domain-containing protein [Klebsiella variicola subsp. variicola]|nr:trypsin-like peptidase domain-containing protein [Klebsiella variicola subsp. variicola]
MQNVHALSLVTALVTLKSGNTPVSTGTGFFYKSSDSFMFLVTNYHVVTGIGPHERGVKPFLGDSLVVQLRDKNGKAYTETIPLILGEYLNWLEHPSDTEADLVLIPLPIDMMTEVDFTYIDSTVVIEDILLHPSSPVVMIGYPRGISDAVNNLPIWKTGSLASEPEYDFNGKKIIVVDISAFPGMSGSPALFVSTSGYETKSGSVIMKFGMSIHFLGIFASMQVFNSTMYIEQLQNKPSFIASQSESLQLGHVWKASLIEETAKTLDPNNYPSLKLSKANKVVAKSGFICKF